MSQREILSITTGRPTSDGAGVSLTRVFGGAAPERFDPFLMLDEFGSNDPDEYIAGFPPHPHRGFEPSPICSRGACVTRITWAMSGGWKVAACSG